MTVMKKELNVKGLTTLWSRDKDGSYVDDGIKNTIIQELLTKKRNAHVLDLAEKAKMPVNITAERVSMEEARSFMNDGVNPLEAHIISYHEKMLIEKKNTDRKKRETMKLLGTLEPEELTEAILACILLTAAKHKKEKMDQGTAGLGLSRRRNSERREYSRKANEKKRDKDVLDFTGASISEEDRREQEKYAARFGMNVYKDL